MAIQRDLQLSEWDAVWRRCEWLSVGEHELHLQPLQSDSGSASLRKLEQLLQRAARLQYVGVLRPGTLGSRGLAPQHSGSSQSLGRWREFRSGQASELHGALLRGVANGVLQHPES